MTLKRDREEQIYMYMLIVCIYMYRSYGANLLQHDTRTNISLFVALGLHELLCRQDTWYVDQIDLSTTPSQGFIQ